MSASDQLPEHARQRLASIRPPRFGNRVKLMLLVASVCANVFLFSKLWHRPSPAGPTPQRSRPQAARHETGGFVPSQRTSTGSILVARDQSEGGGNRRFGVNIEELLHDRRIMDEFGKVDSEIGMLLGLNDRQIKDWNALAGALIQDITDHETSVARRVLDDSGGVWVQVEAYPDWLNNRLTSVKEAAESMFDMPTASAFALLLGRREFVRRGSMDRFYSLTFSDDGSGMIEIAGAEWAGRRAAGTIFEDTNDGRRLRPDIIQSYGHLFDIRGSLEAARRELSQ